MACALRTRPSTSLFLTLLSWIPRAGGAVGSTRRCWTGHFWDTSQAGGACGIDRRAPRFWMVHTVVAALNAESPTPNEFPYNGWSLHLSSCSCRRRPWPRVCQVGNGSRWQAVAWTSEAHPSTYPTTPSSRDHLPLALPSPGPLVASCCRAEPACSHAWLGCDRPADLVPEATQLKLASHGQPGWVDD